MTVRNCDSILADNVREADSFIKRFVGLMGKRNLSDGEGLLLNTSAVHCFFMKIPIDAVYISKQMTVLGTETIRPWRVGKWFKGTKYILELQAGAAASVTAGSLISLER
jgi:uncharacterized membrane protein (UPF0127 family)